MAQASNIKDREHSKFVQSPTRANESAVETLSYSKSLPYNVTIAELNLDPSGSLTYMAPDAAKLILKSKNIGRFKFSFDNINWVTIPLGGWVTIEQGNKMIHISNLLPKTLKIEVLLCQI